MRRNEFIDAIRDARLDLRRDGILYIDPVNQSSVAIATKIRTALEICDQDIRVRRIRYPQKIESSWVSD